MNKLGIARRVLRIAQSIISSVHKEAYVKDDGTEFEMVWYQSRTDADKPSSENLHTVAKADERKFVQKKSQDKILRECVISRIGGSRNKRGDHYLSDDSRKAVNGIYSLKFEKRANSQDAVDSLRDIFHSLDFHVEIVRRLSSTH